MRVGAIGIGQAGGRILDLLTYHSRWGIGRDILPFSLAINTAEADLRTLKVIPKRDRILIGVSQARGHGVGLIREEGATLTEEALPSIMRSIVEKSIEYIDAFWIVVGLGGGTGSGGAPVIASKLKQLYDQPVYVLGALPTRDEGNLMTENAVACLKELHPIVDGTLIFDNDQWRKEGAALDQCYGYMNYEFISPFPILLAAGEVPEKMIGIKVVDGSDIIATLKDLSFIGYWKLPTRTFAERFLFFFRRRGIERMRPALACSTAVRNAATKMSGDCDSGRATKALMVIAAPPKYTSMEGYSDARFWLQNYYPNAEIRGGDFPMRGTSEINAVLLVGGVREIPRLGLKLEDKKK